MIINVALVTSGHSQYDDKLWDWLGKHRHLTTELNNEYDYSDWWGLFLIVGCEIDKDEDTDTFFISWNGSIDELIARLEKAIK